MNSEAVRPAPDVETYIKQDKTELLATAKEFARRDEKKFAV